MAKSISNSGPDSVKYIKVLYPPSCYLPAGFKRRIPCSFHRSLVTPILSHSGPFFSTWVHPEPWFPFLQMFRHTLFVCAAFFISAQAHAQDPEVFYEDDLAFLSDTYCGPLAAYTKPFAENTGLDKIMLSAPTRCLPLLAGGFLRPESLSSLIGNGFETIESAREHVANLLIVEQKALALFAARYTASFHSLITEPVTIEVR